MEDRVKGNKKRGGWRVVKERKHDHTEDGNRTEYDHCRVRRMETGDGHSEEKLQSTVYTIRSTEWIMPSRRQMAAWLWVWSSTTTITKTTVLFLLLDLVLIDF